MAIYLFISSLLLIQLLYLDEFVVKIPCELGYSCKENIYST